MSEIPKLLRIGRAVRGITPDDERMRAIDTVAEYLREYFRDGSSEVRVILDDIPRHDWDEIEGQVARRYPEGEVKIERLCIGVQVEFVPAREEGAA